jgi:hypothetical protein
MYGASIELCSTWLLFRYVQIVSEKRVIQKSILLANVLLAHLMRWPRQVLRKLQMVTQLKFKGLR